jgi:hypothetical protein
MTPMLDPSGKGYSTAVHEVGAPLGTPLLYMDQSLLARSTIRLPDEGLLNSQRHSLRCSRIVAAIAIGCVSVMVFLNPGIVTFFSAKAN